MRATGLIWAVLAAAVMAWASTERAAADVLRVPEDYPTIQAAIDAVDSSLDIVLVAPGVYTEHLVVVENSVTLCSSGGYAVTILDGLGGGIGLNATDASFFVRVEGFTFRNYSVGMYAAWIDANATSCFFTNCTIAGFIFEHDGYPEVDHCIFVDNGGSGISYPGTTNSLSVSNSLFERNLNSAARLISGDLDTFASFSNCVFRENSGTNGGAIEMQGTALGLTNCVFEDNHATNRGGAVYWQDFRLSVKNSVFRNNTAATAGGALAGRNSTFGGDDCLMEDSLLEGNFALVGEQIAFLTGLADLNDDFTMTCNVIEGGLPGIHVEEGWTVLWDDSSNLQDMSVQFGTLITAGILKLTCSDDRAIRVRSQAGFAASAPNIVDLRVGAISPEPSPQFIDLTFEGRLNQPGGSGRLRLRNWTTGNLFRVRDFSIGSTEITEVVEGIDAANFVRASDGRIEVSVFESVIATFSASGFDSFTDWVQVAVR